MHSELCNVISNSRQNEPCNGFSKIECRSIESLLLLIYKKTTVAKLELLINAAWFDRFILEIDSGQHR